jgi:hypothetical protein
VQFQSIEYSLPKAEAELGSFKTWLSDQTFFGETAAVDEIKARPQMCCLLGANAGIHAPDLIKFELELKGIFRTDLALGHDASRKFALIEFEDAKEDSLFRKATSQYRYWGRRLEQGFGQIVDWAWVRNENPNDSILQGAFGGRINNSAYIVICGRDVGIKDDLERSRFEYRRNKTRIEGIYALFLTYDDFVKALEDNLAVAKSYSFRA